VPRRTRDGPHRAESFISIFQRRNTRPTHGAAPHAAREGRGAGCGGGCCEGRVGCREGRELGGVLRGMRHLPAAGNPQTRARRPPRCPWATREGRAREGRGVGLGAGRGGGRLRCREGRVTVLIVPSRSSASSSGGKPQAHHTRAAAHAAREGRGAGCGGGCCEGRVGCREGRELDGGKPPNTRAPPPTLHLGDT